jgi:iron complex outermembrane receptor protein
MNLRLKQSTGKTEIGLHTGQHYEGDGEKFSMDIYRGFSFNKKGHISIASSILIREPTYRGGMYDGTVYKKIPPNSNFDDSVRIRVEDESIIAARNFDRKKVIGNIGNIQQLNAGILLNGAYKIKSNAELFGMVAFNYKKVRRESEYRFPKDSTVVNPSLYPDGFGPISTPNTKDVSAIAGIRGETKNKWYWEVSSSFGRNNLIRKISNTNNPSQSYLGKEAQTSFHPGKLIYNQLTNNINLTRKFTGLPDNITLFNIGCGAEWRWENFKTKAVILLRGMIQILHSI